MVLKTLWFESSESIHGEFEVNLGRIEEMSFESEMREKRRWRFDKWERESLRDPIYRLNR